LEHFTEEGVPQRSWLRMRMVRVAESDADLQGGALVPPRLPPDSSDEPPDLPNGPTFVHSVSTIDAAGESVGAALGERLDQLAFRYYGDPDQWRMLAWLNNISDPLCLAAGQIIQVATRSDLPEPQR